MRLIAFLFLAAFAMAGIIRHSKGAASAPVAALVSPQVSRPFAPVDAGQPPRPLASPGVSQPAPHVLRHKRRFAKAALRAIRQAAVQEKTPPLKQMAKVVKQARR
jgi:hypothetical protein